MSKLLLGMAVFLIALACSACSQTYPSDKVQEAIQEICRNEYGIEKVEAKIIGKTVGVFLPVKRLFVSNFKEVLSQGNLKIADLENLFRPSPDALEQVEDVLFSISRVILSTDRKLEFYLLQAVDVDETGLQLVLVGYVDDIKRVRFWDISRDEYRKRVLHEIKLNRGTIWNRPVQDFFEALEHTPSFKKLKLHFAGPVAPELFKELFFVDLHLLKEGSVDWQLGELRSTPLQSDMVLVYAPVKVKYDPTLINRDAVTIPSGSSLEYLFIVSFASEEPEIVRVIPLSYLDEDGTIQKIPLPEELNLERDLETWETEFSFSEIQLGDFLAEQLTRRTQALLYADERIQNTFERIHLLFGYHQKDEKGEARNHFSLELDLRPKSPVPLADRPSLHDEDVLYLLNMVSREFVSLLRSYRFSDYEFLQLSLATDPMARFLGREDLELFRQNKLDVQGLLGKMSPLQA